jgi:FxsC-like protein
MPYEFFLSYTRANNDVFLKKFFDELSQAIRDIRGLPQTAEVGFFDQQNLELGEQWDNTIVEALQMSSVLVAIASPGYFKSEYCGKEWELFRQRIAAAAGGQPLPPLIKPVIWIPFTIGVLAPTVTEGQLTFGDPQAIQNQRGFKYLLKNLQEHEGTFNNLIEGLAREITGAADQHPVSRLAQIPRLQSVQSAFVRGGPGGAAGAPAQVPTGPKHVRFVYVEANPAAFGAARAREPYVDTGGADWKPFFPDDTTRIHRFVQNFVSGDDLDFTSEELPFGPNLLAEIDDAWQKRQIVVLIVDGWSLQWNAGYRAVLSQLDRRLDYHWCVLVPNNAKDQDSALVRAQIDAAVSQTFDRHANLAPNPLFYRDNIKSAADLKSQLRDVLTKLKEEIKKRAPVDMPVPAGPSRTVINGPSAQG